MASFIFSFAIYMFAKRREMVSFITQQVMLVVQEGMEKKATTIDKVGASVVKEMAPVYGEIAKEISRAIKEGQKEAEDNKE